MYARCHGEPGVDSTSAIPKAVTWCTKSRPKRPIPVTQEIARGRLPWKGFAEVLGGPFGSRVSGSPGVENPTSVVSKHQEDVQDLETDRRYGEEVYRHQGREVIGQERSPRLRRRSAVAPHVLPNAGLTDVDAKFE